MSTDTLTAWIERARRRFEEDDDSLADVDLLRGLLVEGLGVVLRRDMSVEVHADTIDALAAALDEQLPLDKYRVSQTNSGAVVEWIHEGARGAQWTFTAWDGGDDMPADESQPDRVGWCVVGPGEQFAWGPGLEADADTVIGWAQDVLSQGITGPDDDDPLGLVAEARVETVVLPANCRLCGAPIAKHPGGTECDRAPGR